MDSGDTEGDGVSSRIVRHRQHLVRVRQAGHRPDELQLRAVGAKAIVSIPSALFRFTIATETDVAELNAQKNLISAEQELLNAQKELAKTQLELRQARQDLENAQQQ